MDCSVNLETRPMHDHKAMILFCEILAHGGGGAVHNQGGMDKQYSGLIEDFVL